MNLEKIQAKLDALKAQQTKQASGGTGSDLIWKPSPGKQVIRILPNAFDPDYPFIELLFYYDFGKTWLSPSVNGNPDPVIDFCNNLLDSGKKVSKEEFVSIMNLKRKLLPKDRVYVPILVRDHEDEGVKFWGFAKTIHQELLSIMADTDYGDITDLDSGRDITVEYLPAAKEGEFAKTKILAKPNTSKVDSSLRDKIKNMPNLVKVFTEPTFEELDAALKTYLKVSPGSNEPAQEVQSNSDNSFDTSNFQPPKVETSNDTVASKSTEDIEKLFDQAFSKKG